MGCILDGIGKYLQEKEKESNNKTKQTPITDGKDKKGRKEETPKKTNT